MPPQLVLEIKRFKISKDVWSTSKSRRIVAFAEGSYHGKIVKSVDSKVYSGTKLCLPWNETLQRLQINFYFIDDLLTIDIGTALYAISEDGKFGRETATTEVTLKIFPVGATVPVGRALVSITVQDMFDDENIGAHKCAVPKQTAIDHDFAVPGFRFKRLSRVLHWERIRSMNLSQTVQNGDVRTLLTCLDDVTCGDVSQEDIDPQLYKALQMAQYGSQYLLSCRKVMKDRESVLKAALKAFQQEEDVLDLKLAKLRARDKALQREARDLDDLTVEYSSALKEVNPRLINTLYKTYKEKVRIPSTGQLVEMADQRKLNYADDYDRNSSDGDEGNKGDTHHRHGYHKKSSNRSGRLRPTDWEGAPPVSEQMNLQPREPHVFDLTAALGPRRTLRHPHVGSSRQIGDPWASTDSKEKDLRDRLKVGDKTRSADWVHQRHEEDFESETAYNNASNQNVPINRQSSAASWKSSTIASAREISTGHTVSVQKQAPSKTVIDRSQQQGWAEQQVQSLSDDDNSESEPESRDESGGPKRVVSRTEFASGPAQPVLRTLSVRSISVNADPVSGVVLKEQTSDGSVDDAINVSGPRPSASINVARDGWSGAPLHGNTTDRQLASTTRPAQLPAVQQSTGDMSAATAMSVDSLNPRMTHVQTPNMQDNIAARNISRSSDRFHQHDYSHGGMRESEADFSRNNESYENIDMSSFVQPSSSSNNNSTSHVSHNTVDRDFRGSSHRDESSVSIEDYIADDLREAEREQNMHLQRVRQEQQEEPRSSLQHTLNSTNDSVMVEEFDDSLHMDHRPISGFTSSDADPPPEPQLWGQQVRVSSSTTTPGRAPLLPPSASKNTPKRPERDEVFSPGEYEYSMSHDSPFPDLSGGKNFHRHQDRNQSHISSNASNSRNYNDRSGLSQHTGGSDSYDLDAFEDDDDPFGGRGNSGPQRTLDLTNVTGGSTDIDFVLPSESKDLHRHAPLRASEGAKSQHGGGRSYPYEEPDISGELDLFSPLGGPQNSGGPFGSTHGGGPRGAVRDEDDDVLMGTTKLSSGTRDFGNFSNTFQSRGNGSDRFEQDSLGGTFNSNSTRNKAATFSPMTAPLGPGGEEEEEEEESIPPPTYDSMIGTGNTEDSLHASSVSRSQLQHSQDEVSSYFEISADAPGPHAPHHLHMHTVQTEAEVAGTVPPSWQLGRAPVDAIELASAFDIFVSAVRLDAQHARIYSEIQIKVEFLGIMSPLSSVVDLSRTQSVQPVSFSAHLLFSAAQEELLQQEIAELDDAIACQIHVLDAVTQEIVGTANVQLWVMVEDSVNILRQEVEVLNLDMSSDMGSALVDVKGFRLLKKCANAQRQRRTGH